MAYSEGVLDLNPYFYFPMNVSSNFIPVDIVSDYPIDIVGDYGYDLSKNFSSNSITIFDESYISFESSQEFNFIPATFGMWVYSDIIEDNIDIFSIHSGSAGFGISYSKSSGSLIIHNYGSANEEISIDISKSFFLTIEIVPDIIIFGPQSNTIYLKINSDIVYQKSEFIIPTDPEVTIGSLNNFSGKGQISVSDLFYLQSTISQYQIDNLYSLGLDGYEIFPFNSSSDISVVDANNTFLQTAWQAYGEVTTKR